LQTGVDAITPLPEGGFLLKTGKAELTYDKVLIAAGGGPKLSSFEWLAALGHTIVPPVPSLFTFNLEKHPLKELMGVAVNPALLKIEGSKLQSTGPLLVTHWGLSGPAVLRLSAWGARELNERDYSFNLLVDWLPGQKEEEIQKLLMNLRAEHVKKLPANTNPFDFPNRMWQWHLNMVGFKDEMRWADVPNKEINKLAAQLHRTSLPVRGKSTFKEEFVTAGGISLKDVDMKTMQSRKCPGLYFAGEVLDIDGITGGFNFQAAWTTGYIAGTAMGN
jgi:predicted Rossmann fold flavoprotein